MPGSSRGRARGGEGNPCPRAHAPSKGEDVPALLQTPCHPASLQLCKPLRSEEPTLRGTGRAEHGEAVTHRKESGQWGALHQPAPGRWEVSTAASVGAPPRPPDGGAGLEGAACPAPVSSPVPLLHPRGRRAGGPSQGRRTCPPLSFPNTASRLFWPWAGSGPPSRRGPAASSPQSGLGTDLPQVVQRLLTDVDPFCLGSDLNNLWERNCDQQCHLLRA